MSPSDDQSAFCGRANRVLSERLEIAPLTRPETELYLTDVEEFARALRLSEAPREPDPDVRVACDWLIEVGLRFDAASSPYGALWAIAELSTRRMIGRFGFKGEPIDGEAEICYGIDPAFRGRGFATEAIRALVDWGWTRRDLRGLVAETLKENAASRRVLTKCGFAVVGEERPDEDALFWRIERPRRS
ncbi:MAG: GNAT family N-acetyltransferase [Thermoguttaceae bacterium]|nr:GNAT family N-acetyltransferase [Thermoguttaceae bacterium]